MEENLRRTLQVSRGDLSVFVTRPISLAFIVATVLILIVMGAPAVRALERGDRVQQSNGHFIRHADGNLCFDPVADFLLNGRMKLDIPAFE